MGGLHGERVDEKEATQKGLGDHLRDPYRQRRKDAERSMAAYKPPFARISGDARGYRQYWQNKAGDLQRPKEGTTLVSKSSN